MLTHSKFNFSIAEPEARLRVQGRREGLPKYNLEQFAIPIPPLSEQKRIVAEIEKQLSKTKQLKEHIIANQEATE